MIESENFVMPLKNGYRKCYAPFTRSSKHRAVIEQTSSKCIQNTRARRVLQLLDVCSTFA